MAFWRPLEPRSEREVALLPGSPLQPGLAIRNGSAGDRGPRKSITIWHAGELAPRGTFREGNCAP